MSFLSRIGRALQWRVDHWYVSTSGWRDDVPRLNPDGTKNYHFAIVHVTCESTVWYARFLEWLAWDNGWVLCEFLHDCDLPRFVREWKRAWDKDEPNEVCTFEEWFGGEWCSLWHNFIENPILQWIWRLKKEDRINSIELTPAEAREAFKYNPEKLEWVWKSIEEHKQWDAEEEAEKQQQKASD